MHKVGPVLLFHAPRVKRSRSEKQIIKELIKPATKHGKHSPFLDGGGKSIRFTKFGLQTISRHCSHPSKHVGNKASCFAGSLAKHFEERQSEVGRFPWGLLVSTGTKHWHKHRANHGRTKDQLLGQQSHILNSYQQHSNKDLNVNHKHLINIWTCVQSLIKPSTWSLH